jgi:hypothetical protein
MSELEKLLNEKRLLEDKIRMLKDGVTEYGQLESIRFAKKAEADDDRVWQICSAMAQVHREYESREEAKKNGREYDRQVKVEYETNRWQVFIREKTRSAAVAKIKQIISDLNLVLSEWDGKEE